MERVLTKLEKQSHQTNEVKVNESNKSSPPNEVEKINTTISDPYQRFGKKASLLRALLAGVKFPVSSLADLCYKAGGEKRIFKLAASDNLKQAYSLKDIIEALGKTEQKFPIRTREQMLEILAKHGQKQALKGKPQLFASIGNT